MERYFFVRTKQGSWQITAKDECDAMRKALWYCWRDGEEFRYLKNSQTGLIVRLVAISDTSIVQL